MQIVEATDNECAVFRRLRPSNGSLMTPDESLFLTTLLLRNKPKKILELGVAAGGSSLVILNAMRDWPDAHLHSIDRYDLFWDGSGRRMGYLVDKYPELKVGQTLYTGGLPCHFLDQIGNNIDFCLLDTMHVLPGEFFDFLSILPYLADNCVIVLHDTELHVQHFNDTFRTTNMLVNAIPGEKFVSPLVKDSEFKHCLSSFAFDTTVTKHLFPNISGVRLQRPCMDLAWSLLSMLTQKWNTFYGFSPDADIAALRAHFSRFYDTMFLKLFDQIVAYQHHLLQRYNGMQEFLESLGPVYIFGANARGTNFLHFCRRHSLPFLVQGFFDLDAKKYGSRLADLPVTEPHGTAIHGKKPYVFLAVDDNEKERAAAICRDLGYTPMLCTQFLWFCVQPNFVQRELYSFNLYAL